LDYDNDGRLDVFLVNGTTLEGPPKGQEPTNHLYRNRGDGTFEDVTVRAGLAQGGWGQGVCAGDYDNDGFVDLAVTYWGQNVLYHNEGDGRFADVSEKTGITKASGTYALGVSTLDFDGDGWTDLYVADDSNPNALYLNKRDGTFEDVGVRAGCAYSQDGKPQ